MWSNTVVHSSDGKVKDGTMPWCTGDAMTEEQVENCIMAEAGRRLANSSMELMHRWKFGEVGIGNTTTSPVPIAALTGVDVESLCIGTGASTTRDGIDDVLSPRKFP